MKEELESAKQKLQSEILAAVDIFEKETGLSVEQIEVVHADYGEKLGGYQTVFTNFTLKA